MRITHLARFNNHYGAASDRRAPQRAILASSRLTRASSPAEAKVLKGMGKLVISGRPEMLSAGASVAIVEDGGKPKILLHRANLAASGVAVSDAILKVGEAL